MPVLILKELIQRTSRTVLNASGLLQLTSGELKYERTIMCLEVLSVTKAPFIDDYRHIINYSLYSTQNRIH